MSSIQDKVPKHNRSYNWTAQTTYRIPRVKQNGEENSWPNSVYDFDDYDSNIFRLPNSQSNSRRSLQRKKTRVSEVEITNVFRRQNSEPEIHQNHNPDFTPVRNPSLTSLGSDRSALVLPLESSASPAITIPAKQKIARSDQFVSSSFGAFNIESKSFPST